MARIIVTCGRLCSGKTTYATALSKSLPAVHFSVDDLTLLLLGPYPGDILNEYVEKLEGYFFEKSIELAERGISSVIDIGLWTRAEREAVRKFYRDRGAACELHYISVSEPEWRRRIEKRNRDIEAGLTEAYTVDENLLKKFESFFEAPSPDEVDVTVSEQGLKA